MATERPHQQRLRQKINRMRSIHMPDKLDIDSPKVSEKTANELRSTSSKASLYDEILPESHFIRKVNTALKLKVYSKVAQALNFYIFS